ncbi:MAG: hypothetical protein OEW50_10535 [Gammaproteobacteria bacterium]|nr:hypothetical protein [Gammaproteobacteria bacterium]
MMRNGRAGFGVVAAVLFVDVEAAVASARAGLVDRQAKTISTAANPLHDRGTATAHRAPMDSGTMPLRRLRP